MSGAVSTYGETSFPGRRPARRPGQLDAPEWVMVGVAVDNGRKRIYASRDLPDAYFGIHQEAFGPPEHQITSVMKQMLTVTEDSYPQCLARIQEIWDNHDREAARTAIEGRQAKSAEFAAAYSGQPDQAEIDAIVQRALPPGKSMPTCGDPDCDAAEHAAGLAVDDGPDCPCKVIPAPHKLSVHNAPG